MRALVIDRAYSWSMRYNSLAAFETLDLGSSVNPTLCVCVHYHYTTLLTQHLNLQVFYSYLTTNCVINLTLIQPLTLPLNPPLNPPMKGLPLASKSARRDYLMHTQDCLTLPTPLPTQYPTVPKAGVSFSATVRVSLTVSGHSSSLSRLTSS